MTRTRAAVLLSCVFAISASPAWAATDAFLKIEGVEGESQDPAHRFEIDVLSWSWGPSRSSPLPPRAAGANASPGATSLDMTVTKRADSSSIDLFQACVSGKHFKEATLTLRRADGIALEYYLVFMRDVRITSVSTAADTAEDRLIEHVSLNFGKVDVVWMPQRDDGGNDPPLEYGYDPRAGKKE